MIETKWQGASSMITLARPRIVCRIFSQMSMSFLVRSK
jgi:hypothetical protein